MKNLIALVFMFQGLAMAAGPESFVGLYESQEKFPTTDGQSSVRVLKFEALQKAGEPVSDNFKLTEWAAETLEFSPPLMFFGVNKGPHVLQDYSYVWGAVTKYQQGVLSTEHYPYNEPSNVFRTAVLVLRPNRKLGFQDQRKNAAPIQATLSKIDDPQHLFACWSHYVNRFPSGRVADERKNLLGISEKNGRGGRTLKFWERRSAPGILFEVTLSGAAAPRWAEKDLYTGKILTTTSANIDSLGYQKVVARGTGDATATIQVFCRHF